MASSATNFYAFILLLDAKRHHAFSASLIVKNFARLKTLTAVGIRRLRTSTHSSQACAGPICKTLLSSQGHKRFMRVNIHPS